MFSEKTDMSGNKGIHKISKYKYVDHIKYAFPRLFNGNNVMYVCMYILCDVCTYQYTNENVLI